MREDQIDNLLNAVLLGIGLVLLVTLLLKVVALPAPPEERTPPRQVAGAKPGQAVPVVDCPALPVAPALAMRGAALSAAHAGTRDGGQAVAEQGVQRMADAGTGMAAAAAGTGGTACQ